MAYPQAVDRDHVGMVQVRGGPGLGPELFAKSGLSRDQPWIEDLEGTDAVEPEVAGPVDAGHRASAQECLHLVMVEPLADERIPAMPARAGLVTPAEPRARGPAIGFSIVSSSEPEPLGSRSTSSRAGDSSPDSDGIADSSPDVVIAGSGVGPRQDQLIHQYRT